MTASTGSFKRAIRIFLFAVMALIATSPIVSDYAGKMIGPGILHPWRLTISYARREQFEAMLKRTGATKEDFTVRAKDGIELCGWKVRPPSPTGDWVLLFHGIADNRTGVTGHAEFFLRHGYGVVMMDLRAQGESGGDMETYGWKERWDTVAIADALYRSETVRHLFAHGVSLGAAIALQSAAVEPRIAAVSAESPFADLREVTYDYAGFDITPWLGKTLFRPATNSALRAVAENGGFDPNEISPEKSVAARAFPVLLICGAQDRRIPCRHDEQIYNAAHDPKELWEVDGAGHAAVLGTAPQEYERRVVQFYER
jgi:alpha-beta hydrolase superfamily lysophospholipase